MPRFVQVPADRLEPSALQGLLEDYASRDGTDYGLEELQLARKVGRLRSQVESGELAIVCDLEEDQWDLVKSERLAEFEL